MLLPNRLRDTPLFLSLVLHGHQADARSYQAKLADHGLHIEIPANWEVPAAAIGSHMPKMQDGERTASPIVHEVYLSPNHSEDWGGARIDIVRNRREIVVGRNGPAIREVASHTTR